jgi:DNA-binding response OmpR family regulator
MGRNLLFVDDDQEACRLIQVLLNRHRPRFAATVAEALRLARAEVFDLYLLSNWMPDGTGIDLCRQIRNFDGNTPIIFLSGVADSADHNDAIRAGANAYIDKPGGLSRLTDTVHCVIRQSEIRSLDAKVQELAAIRSAIDEYLVELQNRQARMDEKSRLAKARLISSIATRQDISDRAYQAFTAAGGARGDFLRLWPAALNEVL